jgi:hypothetical protein
MSDDLLHFKLRLTPEMHDRLKIIAAQNRRTLSAEIIERVERTLTQDAMADVINRFNDKDGKAGAAAPERLDRIDAIEHSVNMLVKALQEKGILEQTKKKMAAKKK